MHVGQDLVSGLSLTSFFAFSQMTNIWFLGKLNVVPRKYWLHMRKTLRVENESLWSNPDSDFFPGLSTLIRESLKGKSSLWFLQLVHLPLWCRFAKLYTYTRKTDERESTLSSLPSDLKDLRL